MINKYAYFCQYSLTLWMNFIPVLNVINKNVVHHLLCIMGKTTYQDHIGLTSYTAKIKSIKCSKLFPMARNLFGGSSFFLGVGVEVKKIFIFSERFEELRWNFRKILPYVVVKGDRKQVVILFIEYIVLAKPRYPHPHLLTSTGIFRVTFYLFSNPSL